MSSTTGAFKEANPDDFYATPAWVTRRMLSRLIADGVDLSGVVLDPCAGKGAILEQVSSCGLGGRGGIYGIEIDAHRAEAGVQAGHDILRGDALETGAWWRAGQGKGRASLIITNPPFPLAMEFLVRALGEVAEGGTVAFLLRLAFICTEDRHQFHRDNPSDLFPLVQRPSFAASLKCKRRPNRKKNDPTPVCGWKLLLPIDDPRPKQCPLCGAGVDCTTSDSADYAWFVFGPGRGNRWGLLSK